MCFTERKLLAAARPSLLSRAQVEEIRKELKFEFDVLWVSSLGDKDKKTSLRQMEKTDFFTRELDQLVLEKKVDFAIHSAKDLPDPIPDGLKVVYISKGVDSRDALVIKRKIQKNSVIATSSVRREEMVKELFPDCTFVDLRGTIHERLEMDVDGVVVAEAALIRLNLMHLERIYLPGSTAPLQGKLAIVCHEDFEPRFKTQIQHVSLSSDTNRKNCIN